MTSKDVGLRVRCNYNLTDKTVTQSSDLQVDEGHSQEVTNPTGELVGQPPLQDEGLVRHAEVGDHSGRRGWEEDVGS